MFVTSTSLLGGTFTVILVHAQSSGNFELPDAYVPWAEIEQGDALKLNKLMFCLLVLALTLQASVLFTVCLVPRFWHFFVPFIGDFTA